MFKLPVCPHCHTIYRYGDVKKQLSKKESQCYHCGKKFRASKKKILILFLIIALFTAIFDVLELFVMAGTSFLGLMITNIIALTAGFLLIPFFTVFNALNDDKNSDRRKR